MKAAGLLYLPLALIAIAVAVAILGRAQWRRFGQAED